MASKVMTAQEIERVVMLIDGTWIKRRNARKNLTDASNKEVSRQISKIESELRKLKACGASQQDLRLLFSDLSRLKNKLI